MKFFLKNEEDDKKLKEINLKNVFSKYNKNLIFKHNTVKNIFKLNNIEFNDKSKIYFNYFSNSKAHNNIFNICDVINEHVSFFYK